MPPRGGSPLPTGVPHRCRRNGTPALLKAYHARRPRTVPPVPAQLASRARHFCSIESVGVVSPWLASITRPFVPEITTTAKLLPRESVAPVTTPLLLGVPMVNVFVPDSRRP